MGSKRKTLLTDSGQAIVEYMLLTIVLVTIFNTIVNSNMFQNYLGQDSNFFKKLAATMTYSYRYGTSGQVDTFEQYQGTGHELYYENGRSRFFSPKEAIDGP